MSFNKDSELIIVQKLLMIFSDSGSVSVLVFLDLSAAFKTIDHQILIYRLEQVVVIRGIE